MEGWKSLNGAISLSALSLDQVLLPASPLVMIAKRDENEVNRTQFASVAVEDARVTINRDLSLSFLFACVFSLVVASVWVLK